MDAGGSAKGPLLAVVIVELPGAVGATVGH
jgi:hypothetical protein